MRRRTTRSRASDATSTSPPSTRSTSVSSVIDLASQQRTRALAGVAFERVALERRRHEQQRPPARLAGFGEAAEQSAELARANRPDDELERHDAITRLDGGRLSLP